MAQPQVHQDPHLSGMYPGYTYGHIESYFDEYVIVNDEITTDVWYFVKFDAKLNAASWTKNQSNAKHFDSEKDATAAGQEIHRKYHIEEIPEIYMGYC